MDLSSASGGFGTTARSVGEISALAMRICVPQLRLQHSLLEFLLPIQRETFGSHDGGGIDQLPCINSRR
jgi:hypothetical protein